MTIGADGLTPYGATPEDVARALDAWGADVIGLNCSVGPQTILEAIEKMAPVTRRKLSAQPNAGMPRDVERAQHVHGEPRVHGDVRAPPRAGGREDRRRLLRHDARAHPRDGRGHSSARAAASRDASARASGAPAQRRARRDGASASPACRAGAVRRALALGRRRSRAASSSRRSRSCRRAASMRRACSPTSRALKTPASTR